MARPKTKAELQAELPKAYERLQQAISNLSEEQRVEEIVFSEAFLLKHKEVHWTRDKNLRDILIHLYEWQLLLLHCLENLEADRFLPEPYNWRTYGQMNDAFVTKHQHTTLSEASELLEASHRRIEDQLQRMSEEELFEKGRFRWAGHSHAASYFTANTISHYEWARKKITYYRKHPHSGI